MALEPKQENPCTVSPAYPPHSLTAHPVSEDNLLLLLSLLGEDLGVRVQAEHDLLVAQRVLLLDGRAASSGLTLGGVEGALDFAAVDQTSKIGLRNNVGRQEVVALVLGGLGGGAVDLVEGVESGRGPDDEAAEVTTGCELEEVEGGDGAGLDTGDVAEAVDELLAVGLGVVDDEGTTTLAVAAATELALTGANLLGALDLLDVGTGANGLEEGQSGSSAGNGVSGNKLGVDDEGNLGDGHDLVTTGQQQRRDGRGGNSRGNSVTLLALVDLDVPAAPDLGRGEHATGTAHVTESSLTSTVSTGTRDTRDTGDGTTYREAIVSNLSSILTEFRRLRRFASKFQNEQSSNG